MVAAAPARSRPKAARAGAREWPPRSHRKPAARSSGALISMIILSLDLASGLAGGPPSRLGKVRCDYSFNIDNDLFTTRGTIDDASRLENDTSERHLVGFRLSLAKRNRGTAADAGIVPLSATRSQLPRCYTTRAGLPNRSRPAGSRIDQSLPRMPAVTPKL